MFAQQKVTLPKGRHKIIILDEADRFVSMRSLIMPLFLMQVLVLNTQIWNSCEFSDVKFRKSLERGTFIWMVTP